MAFISFQPHDHFDSLYYDGSDSTLTINSLAFKPDALLFKRSNGSNGDTIFNNSTRGVAHNWKPSQSNSTDTTVYVASYTSNGCTLTGNLENTNNSGDKYVTNFWKANGASTTTNGAGVGGASIASVYQANTTAGFSIVTYTGTGTAGTIKHGLSVAPKFIMVKNTEQADRGKVLCMGTTFVADPQTDNNEFAYNGAGADSTSFNDTAPTTAVFSVGTDAMTNQDTKAIEAYCFAEVQGYSKFGFYSGTGNIAGTKIYCGFKPKMIVVKNIDATEDWAMKSPVRSSSVGTGGELKRTLKLNGGMGDNATIQAESNGFRMASSDGKVNGTDVKYVYMAFAEMPMVGSNGTIALAT